MKFRLSHARYDSTYRKLTSGDIWHCSILEEEVHCKYPWATWTSSKIKNGKLLFCSLEAAEPPNQSIGSIGRLQVEARSKVNFFSRIGSDRIHIFWRLDTFLDCSRSNSKSQYHRDWVGYLYDQSIRFDCVVNRIYRNIYKLG